MTYAWIFGGCYLVALAVIFTGFKRKNDFAAERLRENGASAENVRDFYKTVNAKSTPLLAWATFCFGSVAGALISAIYWLVR
jgi:hypothetical protein